MSDCVHACWQITTARDALVAATQSEQYEWNLRLGEQVVAAAYSQLVQALAGGLNTPSLGQESHSYRMQVVHALLPAGNQSDEVWRRTSAAVYKLLADSANTLWEPYISAGRGGAQDSKPDGADAETGDRGFRVLAKHATDGAWLTPNQALFADENESDVELLKVLTGAGCPITLAPEAACAGFETQMNVKRLTPKTACDWMHEHTELLEQHLDSKVWAERVKWCRVVLKYLLGEPSLIRDPRGVRHLKIIPMQDGETLCSIAEDPSILLDLEEEHDEGSALKSKGLASKLITPERVKELHVSKARARIVEDGDDEVGDEDSCTRLLWPHRAHFEPGRLQAISPVHITELVLEDLKLEGENQGEDEGEGDKRIGWVDEEKWSEFVHPGPWLHSRGEGDTTCTLWNGIRLLNPTNQVKAMQKLANFPIIPCHGRVALLNLCRGKETRSKVIEHIEDLDARGSMLALNVCVAQKGFKPGFLPEDSDYALLPATAAGMCVVLHASTNDLHKLGDLSVTAPPNGKETTHRARVFAFLASSDGSGLTWPLLADAIKLLLPKDESWAEGDYDDDTAEWITKLWDAIDHVSTKEVPLDDLGEDTPLVLCEKRLVPLSCALEARVLQAPHGELAGMDDCMAALRSLNVLIAREGFSPKQLTGRLQPSNAKGVCAVLKLMGHVEAEKLTGEHRRHIFAFLAQGETPSWPSLTATIKLLLPKDESWAEGDYDDDTAEWITKLWDAIDRVSPKEVPLDDLGTDPPLVLCQDRLVRLSVLKAKRVLQFSEHYCMAALRSLNVLIARKGFGPKQLTDCLQPATAAGVCTVLLNNGLPAGNARELDGNLPAGDVRELNNEQRKAVFSFFVTSDGDGLTWPLLADTIKLLLPKDESWAEGDYDDDTAEWITRLWDAVDHFASHDQKNSVQLSDLRNLRLVLCENRSLLPVSECSPNQRVLLYPKQITKVHRQGIAALQKLKLSVARKDFAPKVLTSDLVADYSLVDSLDKSKVCNLLMQSIECFRQAKQLSEGCASEAEWSACCDAAKQEFASAGVSAAERKSLLRYLAQEVIPQEDGDDEAASRFLRALAAMPLFEWDGQGPNSIVPRQFSRSVVGEVTVGYLKKRSEWILEWRRRYFELDGTVLSWYEEQAASRKQGKSGQCISWRSDGQGGIVITMKERPDLYLMPDPDHRGDERLLNTLKARLEARPATLSSQSVPKPSRWAVLKRLKPPSRQISKAVPAVADGMMQATPSGRVEEAPLGRVEATPSGRVEEAASGRVEETPSGRVEEATSESVYCFDSLPLTGRFSRPVFDDGGSLFQRVEMAESFLSPPSSHLKDVYERLEIKAMPKADFYARYVFSKSGDAGGKWRNFPPEVRLMFMQGLRDAWPEVKGQILEGRDGQTLEKFVREEPLFWTKAHGAQKLFPITELRSPRNVALYELMACEARLLTLRARPLI